MKSPREILLDRHRERSLALDEIREQVIAEQVLQRRTGILPVTERVASNELARKSDATVVADRVAQTANGEARELTVGAQLASASDRQDACPALLATLRLWLSFNRIAWGSFGVAWLVIIGLNLSTNVEATAAERSPQLADAESVMEGVQRYRTQLAVLLMDEEFTQSGDEFDRSDSSGPRSDVTRPRRNARLQNLSFA